MNPYKRLTTATLISNLLIIIGAGHGIAPICIFELIVVPLNFHELVFSLSLKDSYENTLAVAAIISFLGQALLFISLWKQQTFLKAISLILLWVGFVYLVHNLPDDDVAAKVGFFTGLPFLILSILLFVLRAKTYFGNVDR